MTNAGRPDRGPEQRQQNRQLVGGTSQAWAADVPGSADRYVALFKPVRRPRPTCRCPLSSLGIGSATVTDLWSGAGLGTVSGTLTAFAGRPMAPGCTGSHPQSTVPPTDGVQTWWPGTAARWPTSSTESTADGANVVQWTSNGQTNQRWQVKRRPAAAFVTVVSVNSGKCLDVFGGPDPPPVTGVRGGAVDVQTGGTNQQWRIQDLGTGFVNLIARPQQQVPGRQRCVHGRPGRRSSSGPATGATNQQWQRRPGLTAVRPQGRDAPMWNIPTPAPDVTGWFRWCPHPPRRGTDSNGPAAPSHVDSHGTLSRLSWSG